MKMTKVTLISVAFVFLAGCGYYELGGEDMLSLDEALARVRERHSDNIYRNNGYFWDLQHLWRQAPKDDKEIIEKEMLAFSLKRLEIYGDHHPRSMLHDLELLKQQATNEQVRTTIERKISEFMQAQSKQIRQKQEEGEREERERVERLRTEFERERNKLIENSNGTLRDKSTRVVKKLVDDWQQDSLRSQLWWKDYEGFFSAETFYKIFGKPERQQFLSGDGLFTVDSYFFYYDCKDGLVQIQVSAVVLDDDGIVLIKELNIF